MKNSLLSFFEGPWAITERALQTMLTIYERRHEVKDLEAVAAKLGRPLENTGNRVEMRGKTAILGVEGPLFRYANLLTEVSGATSVEMLARDFGAALDNPAVDTILLNINSPGGQADGVGELAAMIAGARGRKDVVAYIGGLGASGAYWLASAASRIVMHETAFAGSIGVVATAYDNSEQLAKEGIRKHEIVSSQSPRKRLDPATEDGKAGMQEMVDAMAAVFVERVAEYRGASVEQVLSDFGKGFVLPARQAVEAGMADAVGSFEGLLGAIEAARESSLLMAAAAQPGSAAAEQEEHVDDVTRQAVTADRTRSLTILQCEEATGREELARHLALETDMDAEAARRLLAKAPAQAAAAAARPDVFAEHMRQLGNPDVGVSKDGGDDLAAEVASIVRYLPPNQRRTAQ